MVEETARQTQAEMIPDERSEETGAPVAPVDSKAVAKPRARSDRNKKNTKPDNDEEEEKKETDDEGDDPETDDELPADPDDADDSDDGDEEEDDDDDDDESWNGESGTEDENELIQLKPKQETALKNPQLTPQKIAQKKPMKEKPKGPEKTERSPWQQMVDFFVHGAKGAMIKNGDIPIKESIADKLMVGFGFKSFKEDVLLQQQAKKYWMQKATGKKADVSLLNSERIVKQIKKEERQEKQPQILKELASRKQAVTQKTAEALGTVQKQAETAHTEVMQQARPPQMKSQNPLHQMIQNVYAAAKTREAVPEQTQTQVSPQAVDEVQRAPKEKALAAQEAQTLERAGGLKTKIGNAVALATEAALTVKEGNSAPDNARRPKEANPVQNAQEQDRQQTAKEIAQKKEFAESKRKEEAEVQKIRQTKYDFDNATIIQQLALQAQMQSQALGQLNQARANMAILNLARGGNKAPANPDISAESARQAIQNQAAHTPHRPTDINGGQTSTSPADKNPATGPVESGKMQNSILNEETLSKAKASSREELSLSGTETGKHSEQPKTPKMQLGQAVEQQAEEEALNSERQKMQQNTR